MKMNKKAAALGGLAALVAVGGTWAYFNHTAEITNPFHTEGGYETSFIEHFNPSDGEDWKPGVTVNKEVIASNTGDADVLVRVTMDEVWSRGEGDSKKEFKKLTNKDNGKLDVVAQKNATDGLVDEDGTVVKKLLNNEDWTFNESDGYWYYKTRLAAKTDSKSLLKSVTLASDLDMGKYTDVYAYATNEKAWEELTEEEKNNLNWTSVATEEELKEPGAEAKEDNLSFFVKKGRELDPDAKGYADADYDLTITIDFVQPTEDAVKEAWTEEGYAVVNGLGLVENNQPTA